MTTGTRAASAPRSGQLPLDVVLQRIRGEYRDMPGLQLTHGDAARLLGVEPVACRSLLDHLANLGFLRRRERRQYVLAGER